MEAVSASGGGVSGSVGQNRKTEERNRFRIFRWLFRLDIRLLQGGPVTADDRMTGAAGEEMVSLIGGLHEAGSWRWRSHPAALEREAQHAG